MARISIYVSDEDQQQTSDTLNSVAQLLGVSSYKGATASALVQWLGKQDPQALADALRPLVVAAAPSKSAARVIGWTQLTKRADTACPTCGNTGYSMYVVAKSDSSVSVNCAYCVDEE